MFLILPSNISVWLFRRFLDDDKERNSLTSAKFLVDAQKIYPTKYAFLLPKFLRFALRLAQTDLPKTFLQLFINSVTETRRHPDQRKLISEQIYKSTLGLDSQNTSAHGWKLISLALTGFGFIRSGTVARKYCLETALREVEDCTASNRTLHLAIKGLLESRRFDEAMHLIESHASDLDPISTDKTYGDYLKLMGQQRPTFVTNKMAKVALIEGVPRDLINNKSIALVATSEIKTLSGEDIDQHDTVARIKFQGFSRMPQAKFIGTRCDITAFTKDIVEMIVAKTATNQKYLETFAGVKLIVLKENIRSRIGSIPHRIMDVWAPAFLTTATSGTLFIFDLLRFEPNKVKLFGFNHYTERQIYNSELLDFYGSPGELAKVGLPKNWFDLSSHQKASATIANGFIPHDPRSDFLLVKNLYELSGLIDGTPEVLEILNLTADEYDARLEEMLGDW